MLMVRRRFTGLSISFSAVVKPAIRAKAKQTKRLQQEYLEILEKERKEEATKDENNTLVY